MRIRCGGIIVVVMAFLVVASVIDWPEGQTGKGYLENGGGAGIDTEQVTLRECDSGNESGVGEVVPEQYIPNSEKTLSEAQPDEALPRSAWSNRAGFSISAPTDPTYWAEMLGSGWYLDWNVKKLAQENNPVHWQMVRVHEDCIFPSIEVIQTAATDFPGQVWIIGNEPDVIWQDNVTPEKYAAIYHDLYQLIKSSDPTALIAVGGISQATPLRLEYLDHVLAAYRDRYFTELPADWWTVHGYVLREEKDSWGVEIPPGIEASQGELREVSDHGRIDLFQNQILAFRQWMAGNGYQNTPLALTEFGLIMPDSYGFPPEMIAGYLQQTFTWLYQTTDETSGYPDDAYHLVQKWAWFSISDSTYSASDLGDLTTGKLTMIGEQFRAMVASMIH